MLDSDAFSKKVPFPDMKGTPAARFGYMPPGAGRIDRSAAGPAVVKDEQLLSDKLQAKVIGPE